VRRRSEVAPTLPELAEALARISRSGAALLAEDAGDPEWVVEGLIEQGETVLLTGREKLSLKTWLALDLAIARIIGGEWLGRQVVRLDDGARVLFVSTETSARHVARRVRGLCAGRGVDRERVAGRLVVATQPIAILPLDELRREGRQAKDRIELRAMSAYDQGQRATLEEQAEDAAIRTARARGPNVDALLAIHRSPPGTFGLVLLDTLRQCMVGDESSSADAARYTAGSRALARAVGCPVVSVHHTNKAGDPTDARSARGSVELTAGPDLLLAIDANGEWPTMHVTARNHEAVPALGYSLAVEGEAVRIELRDACASAPKRGRAEISPDDVVQVLRAHVTPGSRWERSEN
jgi:hypothetical protein